MTMISEWEALLTKEQYINVDGNQTRYFDLGTGDPVVLLHGGGLTSSALMNWGAVLEPLGKRTRVIAMDQPGFGFTPIRDERDYQPRERAEYVATMLESLGVTNATVVGNSRGGFIATYLALTRTDLVNKLVVVNSGSASRVSKEDGPTGDLSAPEPSLERARSDIEEGRTKNMVHPENHPFYREPITDDKAEHYHELQKRNYEHNEERNKLHNASPQARNEALSYEGEHISKQADRLTVPTLLTWSTTPQVRPRPHYDKGDYDEKKAEYDQYYEELDEGPMDSGLELFQTIPDAEIHIWQNAKHALMTDKADRWVDVVVNFHQASLEGS